jgi:hypothetical protein
MTAGPDRDQPVEFRPESPPADVSPDDREDNSPAKRPPRRHVLRGRPYRAGAAPDHVEFFCEEDVDGFKTDEPRWVAFCPDCGAKLALREHEACPFFSGTEKDRKGFVVGVHCGFPKRDIPG